MMNCKTLKDNIIEMYLKYIMLIYENCSITYLDFVHEARKNQMKINKLHQYTNCLFQSLIMGVSNFHIILKLNTDLVSCKLDFHFACVSYKT